MKRWFAAFLGIPLVFYLGFVALLYANQRALQYPLQERRTNVVEAGLSGFEDVVLTTADGERLVGFYRPAEPGRALILYFHGNGGSLWNRRDRARMLATNGRGMLMVSYRGYSGSTGAPTEDGLHEDARTAYKFALSAHDPALVVVYGESLGTGVAVRLAAENPVGGIILDAPYTSTASVAQRMYPIVPVSMLMHDQFRSIDIIDRVSAPILIMHGTLDRIIPFAEGEALYRAAPQPKRFVRFEGSGHTRLLEDGGLAIVDDFIGAVEASRTATQASGGG